jgi:molybdopterin converting factor subunit 1
MQIVVLYFAALRELLARSQEQLELASETLTVAELSNELVARHPALGGRLSSVRFALNESFVHLDATVRDGDTVALIPPVAGG